jgi:methylenetetrahydrofolate reductase (NADPH)
MARTAPDLPIYVGMPGPTSPSALVRYARNCGVSTSLRALIDLGFKAAKLVRHTTLEEQLVVLGHHCAGRPACNVVGVHIYSFGGFLASAKWMHQMYANPLAKRTVPG